MIEFSLIPAEKIAEARLSDKDLSNATSFFILEKPKTRYPFGKLNLLFYIDRYGDFMSPKRKTDKLALMIFESLESKDQSVVLQYLMGDEDE